MTAACYRSGLCACGRIAVYEETDDTLICQECYRQRQRERLAGKKDGERRPAAKLSPQGTLDL